MQCDDYLDGTLVDAGKPARIILCYSIVEQGEINRYLYEDGSTIS